MRPPETATANGGLRCPECGGKQLRVEATRQGVEGVVRRRQCLQGHVFYTEEVVCDKALMDEADPPWQRFRRKIVSP